MTEHETSRDRRGPTALDLPMKRMSMSIAASAICVTVILVHVGGNLLVPWLEDPALRITAFYGAAAVLALSWTLRTAPGNRTEVAAATAGLFAVVVGACLAKFMVTHDPMLLLAGTLLEAVTVYTAQRLGATRTHGALSLLAMTVACAACVPFVIAFL